MTKICLVRHGETDWNKLCIIQGITDIPLNDVGREQARQTGLFLKSTKWDKIISSPMIRAKETAEIIADIVCADDIILDKDLVERSYGKAEGLTTEEANKKYPDKNYEDAEKWDILKQRISSSVLRHAKNNENNNIIIVSHGAAINSLLYTLSEGKIGSGKTLLHNGCVNMLSFDGVNFTIDFYNKKVY